LRVYKFLSAHWAKEAIVKRRLKISLLHDLNDPWDGHAVAYQSESERTSWQKAYNSLSQTRGLICTSGNWTDPVLWSHYSDQHRGIALAFEIKGDALPVTYQKDLIPFPADFSKQTVDQKLKFVQSAISTKFSHWHYEREVRFFTDLDEPDLPSGHFFMDFGDAFALKQIIFGARYSSPFDESIILSIARKMNPVECFKAKLGNARFEVEKDESWSFSKL
jgi:hypothetical protein